MIIQSQDIALASRRTYQKEELFTAARVNGKAKEKKEEGQSFDGSLKNNLNRYQETEGVNGPSYLGSLQNRRIVRRSVIDYLFELLFGKRKDLAELLGFDGGGTAEGTGGFQFSQNYFYHEEEATSFSAQGTVKTSDGRTLDFNMELIMSRSFTEAYEEKIGFGLPSFTDPLVINLDCAAADVTDQKFYFDLDADGHEEAMHMPAAGSGFLALDRNGDGKINDGTELFGTKSGNGFKDLAEFDSDHNGWIDEADEIFDKLLIYSIGPDGKETLTGLGKAGVGALYLGSAEGDFSVNDLATNETRAKIRSTGFFFYENGNMGTLQQVDFAS